MIENANGARPRRLPLARILGTVLAVALLVYLLQREGWDEILAAVRQIHAGWLFLALALTISSRLAVSGRWHILLRSAGLQVSAWQTIRITFAGLFASNFLPTTIGGDVVRLGGALRFKWDRAVCVASLVVDRLVGMAGMAMAVPLALPTVLKGLSLAGPTSLACGLFAGQDEPPQGVLGKAWRRGLHIFSRLMGAISLWLKHPASLLLALAFTWLHMVSLFLSIWVLLMDMNEPVSFWLIAGLWSLTYFVTLLPVSINGLGVQELSMTFFFTHFGGISEPTGLTLALLIRVLQMFASLPGALFVPALIAGEEQVEAEPIQRRV